MSHAVRTTPKRRMTTNDLTVVEEEHVRNGLLMLRTGMGQWKSVAKALRFDPGTLINIGRRNRPATASVAFRLARFMRIRIDDLLAGTFPGSGTCPKCGHHLTLPARHKP